MSKKLRSKLKRAALAGIALYSANKMLGAKAAAPTGAPPSAKTPSSSKIKKRVVDLKNPGSSIVGKSTKITVDKDALPREIEEKASAVKAKKAEQFKIVKKRKDEGSAFFRHTSEHATEEYMARKDAAIKKSKGMSRYSSPVNNITYGDKSGPTGYIGEERYDLNQYNPVDDRAGSPVNNMDHSKMTKKELHNHSMVHHTAKPPKNFNDKKDRVYKDIDRGEKKGISRKKKKESLPLGMTKEELGRSFRTAAGTATKKDKRRNKRDSRRTQRHVKKHGSGLIMD